MRWSSYQFHRPIVTSEPEVAKDCKTMLRSERFSKLISWCFKPSQPQRIISGLRETLIKRSVVKRNNKTELRPEEQSEKAESCRENIWNELPSKGP